MKTSKTNGLNKEAKAILKKAFIAPMPQNIEPMLATLVSEPVKEEGWFYEMKWDGYRIIAYLNEGTVELRSRNNKSFNDKYYPLLNALQKWKLNVVVDGELVVVNDEGVPDFEALQTWRSEADGHLVFVAFDMLWLEGHTLMELPIEERRELMQIVLPVNDDIRISQSLKDTGEEAFAQAQKLRLEGVMAKRAGSIYRPGARSKDWLKIKTEQHQELIIGGYTKNEGSNKLFSALLLGIMNNGNFQFVTPVGTGFNAKMQQQILDELKPYVSPKCQFEIEPDYNKPSRFRPNPPKAAVTWVKPKLVAEISYRERTSGGAIRHPSFKGMRADKKPEDVKWETATETKGLIKGTSLSKNKVIAAPGNKERKTLLNPTEETQTRIVNGHELRFTNLSKVFWPIEGYTKRDMINYYFQVVPYLLPYMKDRPQIMNRHPHGIEGQSFYQKDVKGKVPSWIETFPYFSYADNKEKEFFVCTNEASLLYLASLGCIEMNPWHSRRQSPDNPDWCIIDLDPDKNTFEQVIEAARVTKKVLDAIDVPSYPKTSGSSGIHIYIPFGAKYTYEASKEFARIIARLVHNEIPSFTSIERKTGNRGGKMYVDFLQNRPQASVAAPYALRPKKGAPVSTPLNWEEVKKGLNITDYNISNTIARLKEQGDIFKPVIGKGINLEKTIKKIESVFHIAQ